MNNTAAEIRIGTSGWHYKHWRGPFYPAKFPASKMLAFYLERFDTVEINNSFYRLPQPEVLDAWREAVPVNFRFAMKASRFLTHNKKLKDPEEPIDRLFSRAEHLKQKLGPILFQLPPLWTADPERLDNFLRLLPKRRRYAFEFREPSWNSEKVYSVLRKHNAGYCIFHLAGFQSPLEVTADFTYIRLHGPGGRYQGSYSDDDLRVWAERIREWGQRLHAIYIYFDNDDSAFAAHNALRLKELCGLT